MTKNPIVISLERIERWLLSLDPKSTAGITASCKDCLVARYIKDQGGRRPQVAHHYTRFVYTSTGIRMKRKLSGRTSELIRQFDRLATTPGEGTPVSAERSLALVREIKAALASGVDLP